MRLTLLFLSISIYSLGQISGQVKSFKTGLPLKGAEVFVDKSQVSVFTDDKGYFILEGLPKGTLALGCLKAGFETAKKIINVSKRDSTALFILQNETGQKLKDESLEHEILETFSAIDKIFPMWSALRGRFPEYETVSNIRIKGYSKPSVFKGMNHKDSHGKADTITAALK